MALLNSHVSAQRIGPAQGLSRRASRPVVSIAVVHRRQTPDEERRFNAALDLLLVELVRQQLRLRE